MKKLSFLMAVLLCMAVLVLALPAAAERTGISFEVETTNGLKHPTGYYYSPKPLEQIPVTFEAWVYIPSDQYSGQSAVISNYLEIENDEFFDFCINSNGVPTLFVGKGLGKGYATFNFSDAKVPEDEWTHVALVYGTGTDSKQAFCYVNGELKHQTAVEDYVPMTEGVFENTVCIGGDLRSFNRQWFKGELGEVRMYADVRDANEIAADMTTAADRNDADLIMYYELSAEMSGKDVADLSQNGYDMRYGEVWLTEQEMEQLRAADSNEYAYSIAVIPDPQFSTQSYPHSLDAIFDYLLDSKDEKNIQYVLGVGDMTNKNIEAQWENIKAQTERLNGEIPYTAIRGNHDVYNTTVDEFFDQYYADPSGYYYQHVQQNGGFYDVSSVKNTYLLFEVGSVKYLLLNLDFGANDDVLAWADGILSVYHDRRVIATTHGYLDADGTTLDDNDSGSPSTNSRADAYGWNSGEDMWNKLFKKHANVEMVICGHIQQDDIIMRTQTGDAGNTVHQLLIDTQTSDSKIGGGGFVALLHFTEDGNNVRVECYSAVQQKYFRSTSNTITFTTDCELSIASPTPDGEAKAALTYGNKTTYYASLQEAIDAANTGNGGTITLLADAELGTVTTDVILAKHVTIDGQGQYKITASLGTTAEAGNSNLFQPAAGVTLRLQNLDLITTSNCERTYRNAVCLNANNATVIIDHCTIQSTNDTPIRAKRDAANSRLQIKNSTVIGAHLGIYMEYSPCDLVIANSTIIDKLSAVYINMGSTSDVSITNSTLTSGNNRSNAYGVLDIRGAANVTVGADTVLGSAAIDSELAQKYGLTAAEYVGGVYGVQIIKDGAKLTLTGDVTMNGAEADLYKTAGTVDFADYTGAKIIRQSGTTSYYFHDELADALDNAADGDTITLCCNMTLDTAVTVNKSVTIDGQGKYYIQSSADTAFHVNGAIAVTFSNVSLVADNVGFTYDGNADTNTSVALNTVAFSAGTETVGMNDGDTFTNDSTTVAKLSGTTHTIGYLSLQDAIAAANAGNGGTITLLADVNLGTVTEAFTFTQNVTVDGQDHRITATLNSHLFTTANGLTLTLKDLEMNLTSSDLEKYYSPVYTASNSQVIIGGCTVLTDGTAIYNKNATGFSILVTDSTFISGYLGIYSSYSTGTIEIANSTLADKLSAIYVGAGGSNRPTITVTNSTLTSYGHTANNTYGAITAKNGNADITLGAGTVIDSTGTDAKFGTFFADHDINAEDYTGAPYGVYFYNGSAPALTLTGNVTVNGKDADLCLKVGTVDFGKTNAPFTGTQIIRQSGTTYYFYDTVDAAFTAKQDGDTLFAYVASCVQNKGYVTEEATDANGTTYYKVVGLDTTLIDSAISNATEKLNGVVVADKPCAVEVGAEYVLSQDTIDALNDEITAAQAAKTSVATGKDVLDAVQKLIDALETFEEAVQIGKEHKDEGKDHLCDYGCGKNDMGGACADGDDNNHACDYCQGPVEGEECHDSNTDGKCDECGLDIAHECKDEGKDHACDLCGKRMGGDCADSDTDNDHVCDYCGVTKLNDCTPNADDGDCTTAITCSVCNAVTTAAETAHTGGSATCTAKAVCSTCGKAYGELAQHTYDGDTDASCNVCGAERTVNSNTNNNENNTNTNDNNANTNENNAASKGEAPEKQGLSGGAVVGIVIAIVVVLGGGFALFWFVIKKKKA